MKLPGKNIGKTFSDINSSNFFYISLSKTIEMKAKISQWDLIKLGSSGTAKETINKMKRKPTEWEKIFANNVTNMG